MSLPRPEVIETHPTLPSPYDGWYGVGRIVAVDDCLLVNNLYSNLEAWRLNDAGASRPAGVYHDLVHAGEDDLHAVLRAASGRWLLTVNHYGNVDCFLLPLPRQYETLIPGRRLQLLGDTERIVLAGERLVASSPRGHASPDAPRGGIFVSEPMAPYLDTVWGEQRVMLRCEQMLADWGFVSALAASADGRLLAVASSERLGLFALDAPQTPRCLWQAEVPYYTQWLAFDAARERVLVAGYALSASEAGSYEWEQCRGGGVSAFGLDGQNQLDLALPDATAWGYGGVPVVLSRDGSTLYAVDRQAGLHAASLLDGGVSQLYAAHRLEDGSTTPSLGIGHCDVSGRWLYAGYSRGAYRVFRYQIDIG